MSVARICQRVVDLASADEPVRTAAERMHQRTVGCLVIVGAENEPIGIITDRDLMIRVVAAGRDPFTTRVEDVMTREPRVISESSPLEDALSLMRSGAFRRLPVVDHQDRLVGIITLDDILMLLSEEFSQVGQLLHRETPYAAAGV